MEKRIWILVFATILQAGYCQDAVVFLEEIVNLRQQVLDKELALAKDGRRTSAEVNQFRIELLNAKVNLESERQNFDEVHQLLTEILGLQERTLKGLKLLYERGSSSFQSITESQVAVLETKVRIEKNRSLTKQAKE